MTKAKKSKASAPKRRTGFGRHLSTMSPRRKCGRPSRLFLRFADGFEETWTFTQLGLDMSNVKPTTVKATRAGTYLKVKSKWGEDVQLDSSSLRILVDPSYAAELEGKLNALASQIGPSTAAA